MEDEYKVVCALSNGATFDGLEWPRTPVSRSQYSLKANISQTVHPIHSMFGYRLGFSGSDLSVCCSIKSKMAADGHLGYTKMAITSQPVCQSTRCLVLGWGFRGRPIQWCNFRWPWMTPNPSFFQGDSIVWRQISRKRCIRSTPCLVLG